MKYIFNMYFIGTFFISFSCRLASEKSHNDVPKDVVTPADSIQLKLLSKEFPTADFNERIAICEKRIQLAKEKDYAVELFNVYGSLSSLYYQSQNSKTGDIYADSAKWVMEQFKIPNLKPALYLIYSRKTEYAGRDSALYFLEEALRDTVFLTPNQQMTLYADLTRIFLLKKLYKEAKFYTIQLIDQNNRIPTSTNSYDAATFYHYLALADMGLKDTAGAFVDLSKAIKIINDSLDGNGPPAVYRWVGEYYMGKEQYDSAHVYYQKFAERLFEAKSSNKFALPYILLAKAAFAKAHYTKTANYLSNAERIGVETLDPSGIHDYYNIKYQLEQRKGNYREAVNALEMSTKINNEWAEEDRSMQLADLEKRLTQARSAKTIAEKEKSIIRQKTYTILFGISSILLLVIVFLVYINQRNQRTLEKQRRKASEQKLLTEKALLSIQAESKERKRIARELHDELGSTLTSIGLAVEVLKKHKEEEIQKPLEILDRNSRKLTLQANEIVWSLNDRNDNLKSLLAYIYRHCNQFLKDAHINFVYVNKLITIPNVMLDGYKRRYIFQTAKEVVNNAVKHSKCTEINMIIDWKDEMLMITIADNGIGLPQKLNENSAGNGLKNIAENMKSINGNIHFENDNGTKVCIQVILENTDNLVS